MIVLDSTEYKSIDTCRHLFATTIWVEIRYEHLMELPNIPKASFVWYHSLPLVTCLPETPAALKVWYTDLPLVTRLPDTPLITQAVYEHLPLVTCLPQAPASARIEFNNLPKVDCRPGRHLRLDN